MTEIKSEKPEWITWNGGHRPVKFGTMVKVIFRGRQLDREPEPPLEAEEFRWAHHQNDYDIIAYQVVIL